MPLIDNSVTNHLERITGGTPFQKGNNKVKREEKRHNSLCFASKKEPQSMLSS